MDPAPLRPLFDVSSAASSIDRWRWLPELAFEGPVPGARCSHTACALDDTSFVIVGGGVCETPSGAAEPPPAEPVWAHFNDVWRFSAHNASWRRLDRAECGDVNNEAALSHPSPSNQPRMPARRGHAAAFCPVRRLVVVFGGTAGGTGSGGLLGDVWAFDVDKGTWKQPTLDNRGKEKEEAGASSSPSAASAAQASPSPRRGCIGWLDGPRFFVLGGYTGDPRWPFDPALWALDLDKWTWVR